MLKDDEYGAQVVTLLDELKPVPARNPQIAARARARFLAEAVSIRDKRRLSIWTIFQQKEKFAMKLTLSVLVIVGLLFGGSATVSAAQDALPNEPLYQIKLVSEDVYFSLISDPVAQVEILMQQAQKRIQRATVSCKPRQCIPGCCTSTNPNSLANAGTADDPTAGWDLPGVRTSSATNTRDAATPLETTGKRPCRPGNFPKPKSTPESKSGTHHTNAATYQ